MAVELFVGNYKSTDNWKLQARLDNIHMHLRTLVAAASAYPEMGQRDDYQEAMNWLRKDGAKLEKAIEHYPTKRAVGSRGELRSSKTQPAWRARERRQQNLHKMVPA